MIAKISSTLNLPADKIRSEVKKPETMRFIAKPLQYFYLRNSTFPELWYESEFEVDLYAFGFIPLGSQMIRIEFATENDDFFVRDNGYGTRGFLKLIKKWDHKIYIHPMSDTTSYYTDSVDIDAGLLTFFIWNYANIFYRWRQFRWRRV